MFSLVQVLAPGLPQETSAATTILLGRDTAQQLNAEPSEQIPYASILDRQ